MEPCDVDVLIIGAGIAGIDMAYRLTESLPDHTFAILEARAATGGTWDTFRYPGIRSDSDMYTLAFPFRPWTHPDAIASGGAILDYLRATIRDSGLTDRIHLNQRVTSASWSSATARWTVHTDTPDGPLTHTARFLYLATGYFDHDHGHEVDFPGQERFTGTRVHPQHWPDDLPIEGRRFLVIGSGATAVTLVPALVDRGAAHVTMLQRSPTYVVSRPAADPLAGAAFRVLPPQWAHRALRAKNIGVNVLSYQAARRFPGAARSLITKGVARALPTGYAVDPHFTPRYDPWDERLCLVPDGDLFTAISDGRAEVVTDTIATFTETGVRTSSGRDIDADVIVTATGLELIVAGQIAAEVDGIPVDVHAGHVYRGLMLDGVPNMAWCVGYTNNSWTLRADLAATWTCRLLAHLRARGYERVTPRYDPGAAGASRPLMGLSAGYVQRAAHLLPSQGSNDPWVLRQNYLREAWTLGRAGFDDNALEFATAPPHS